tara:strand:- start:10082 stop:10891 length:810 start_codon:yes stop_codon:yes gene_type:complete
MKISVFSLFRDSEKFLDRMFSKLETIENEHELEYFFYENDSKDDTRKLIKEWMSERNGQFIYEDINTPVFGHVTDSERMKLMTQYRNRLLDETVPLNSDYSLLIDSDVDFSNRIVDNYLPFFKDDVVMCTPNIKQNINCIMGEPDELSYYDSFALKDMKGNKGMLLAANPFWEKEDRQNWADKKPVKVRSAFGGVAMIKTDVLNNVRWATRGGCEHWMFCESVRGYGDVIAIPTIEVYTEVKHWTPDPRLEKMQKILLSDPWARLATNL